MKNARMKAVFVQPVLLAIGFALVVIFAVLRSGHASNSYFSTYDSGRNGYRALYAVLRREGLRVARFERPIGLLDPKIGTLVISSNAPESAAGLIVPSIDSADATRLRAFVKRGGHLVLVGSTAYPALLSAFHLSNDVAAKPLPTATVRSTTQTFVPIARVKMNAGVERVRAGSAALFPFAALHGAIPLLGTRKGVAALQRKFGKGSVVAIAIPNLWSNVNLARDDNARFAYSVLARNGMIAFDERVHGYAIDKSFWSALPQSVHVAFFFASAAVLLWLIGANVRHVPACAVEPLDERDSRAYLDAMAALLRRARAGAAPIARFFDDIERQHPRAEHRERAAYVELRRLRSLDRPKDADILHAAQLYHILRKEPG